MMPLWTKIVIHHSATVDGVALDYGGILRFHTSPPPDGRGWQDIAYHYVVERIVKEIVCVVGRPLNMVGAHAPGANHNGIGICLVGDFDHQQPDEEQIRVAARRLICPLIEAFDMDPPGCIVGHRDVTPDRTCPGKNLDLALVRGIVMETFKGAA